MEHRDKVETQPVMTQRKTVALSHDEVALGGHTVEALDHLERLFVAHETDFGVILADERD